MFFSLFFQDCSDRAPVLSSVVLRSPSVILNSADPTAFEDEAELVPNFVTDSTMEAEPFTAAHEVPTSVPRGTRVRPDWKEAKSTIDSFYQGEVGGKRANQQP